MFPADPPASYLLLAAVAVVAWGYWANSSTRQLSSIPTIGPSGPLTSYIGALRHIFDAKAMIQEGYEKYKGGIFKIPLMDRWVVVVSGPKLIDELRKGGDDQLSFAEAVNDLLQVEHTFGLEVQNNPYHVPVIRGQLTRNLPDLFAEVQDEIEHAFSALIPIKGDEWVKVPAQTTVNSIVCRTSNRLFVGLPLCRNPDFAAMHMNFALRVIACATIVNLFPKFMHPIMGRLLTSTPTSVKRCMEFLRPTIEDRLKNIEQYGENWPGKPNDLISWLMDEAKDDRTLRGVTLRILILNFAALHTSSSTFAHALLHLAACPQYLKPLREEIEAVIETDGWTKAAMDKLRKLDSFFKESQRVSTLSLLTMTRKTLKPFMFSDGTIIPANTHVAAASTPMHMDEANYSNAAVFDPFRFANMRDAEGEDLKHQFASTDMNYIIFGHGKHACPGRFFASSTLKAIMAYIVVNYDVKFEKEGVRPPNQWFGTNCTPNQKAEVMFRRRQT